MAILFRQSSPTYEVLVPENTSVLPKSTSVTRPASVVTNFPKRACIAIAEQSVGNHHRECAARIKTTDRKLHKQIGIVVLALSSPEALCRLCTTFHLCSGNEGGVAQDDIILPGRLVQVASLSESPHTMVSSR